MAGPESLEIFQAPPRENGVASGPWQEGRRLLLARGSPAVGWGRRIYEIIVAHSIWEVTIHVLACARGFPGIEHLRSVHVGCSFPSMLQPLVS